MLLTKCMQYTLCLCSSKFLGLKYLQKLRIKPYSNNVLLSVEKKQNKRGSTLIEL